MGGQPFLEGGGNLDTRGSIPVLMVKGSCLAEAWEKSLLALWQEGCRIRTQYDRKDDKGEFIDPPSIDSTMLMVVENPLAEPRFHQCFPGGPADLQEYRMEVVDGIKDHWVDLADKHKWQYTYHERLVKYVCPPAPFDRTRTVQCIDQLEEVAQQLAKSPYTRRAQAITWQPWIDQKCDEPPCLQRVWFRILEDDDGVWRLNMDVDFRSRDAFKAALMNADAFIFLMERMAKRVEEIGGKPVMLGRYCDKSNSYHIYGKDIKQFVEVFLAMVHTRTWENRTYTEEFLAPMMKEAIPVIIEKVRKYDEEHKR